MGSGLADGKYTVEVELAGGTGRATVHSPAKLVVEDGQMLAEIQWSSPNYTSMEADGETYLPVSREGDSLFIIPIPALEEELPVAARTIAMSRPHTVEYTLRFDPDTLRPQAAGLWGWAPLLALLLLGTAVAAIRIRRMKKHED